MIIGSKHQIMISLMILALKVQFLEILAEESRLAQLGI